MILGHAQATTHDRHPSLAFQKALNALGYGLMVDGIWGPATTEATVTDALGRGPQA